MIKSPPSATAAVWAVAVLAISAGGCRQPRQAEFEPNLVHALSWEARTGIDLSEVVSDAQSVLAERFGTPDNPKLPELFEQDEQLASLLSLDHLWAASGPNHPGRGLYRTHCASCHGINGDGRGRTAALVNPYPRDFRAGIFKFKSTLRAAKPLKEDLAKVIKQGIAGSAMVAEYQLPDGTVGPLPDEAVDPLVDYVIYLSIRGQTERSFYAEASFEPLPGDRLLDPTLEHSGDEAELALYQEQRELIEELIEDAALAWVTAEDQLVEVSVPDDLPVPGTVEQLEAMLASDHAEPLQASIRRGHEVFVGQLAGCAKCHGEQGRGDTKEIDYDDWTKEWTQRAGLQPDDTEALIPLIARGALPPRPAMPRNFEEGIFRGGDSPEDLYRRLNQGIAGTPMPAVTLVPDQLEEEDLWHLINFVRSLRQDQQPPAQAAPDAAADDPAVALQQRP